MVNNECIMVEVNTYKNHTGEDTTIKYNYLRVVINHYGTYVLTPLQQNLRPRKQLSFGFLVALLFADFWRHFLGLRKWVFGICQKQNEMQFYFFRSAYIFPKKRKCTNDMKLYFGKRKFWKCYLRQCDQQHKQLRECGVVLNGGTRDIGGAARHHLESYLSEVI